MDLYAQPLSRFIGMSLFVGVCLTNILSFLPCHKAYRTKSPCPVHRFAVFPFLQTGGCGALGGTSNSHSAENPSKAQPNQIIVWPFKSLQELPRHVPMKQHRPIFHRLDNSVHSPWFRIEAWGKVVLVCVCQGRAFRECNETDFAVGSVPPRFIHLGQARHVAKNSFWKLRYLATSSERHKIDHDEFSNLSKGHFQVRSILRSPEVTKAKGQTLRK